MCNFMHVCVRAWWIINNTPMLFKHPLRRFPKLDYQCEDSECLDKPSSVGGRGGRAKKTKNKISWWCNIFSNIKLWNDNKEIVVSQINMCGQNSYRASTRLDSSANRSFNGSTRIVASAMSPREAHASYTVLYKLVTKIGKIGELQPCMAWFIGGRIIPSSRTQNCRRRHSAIS